MGGDWSCCSRRRLRLSSDDDDDDHVTIAVNGSNRGWRDRSRERGRRDVTNKGGRKISSRELESERRVVKEETKELRQKRTKKSSIRHRRTNKSPKTSSSSSRERRRTPERKDLLPKRHASSSGSSISKSVRSGNKKEATGTTATKPATKTIKKRSSNEDVVFPYGDGETPQAIGCRQPKLQKKWCRWITKGFKGGEVKKAGFGSKRWTNGLAFCAILARALPDRMDFEAMKSKSAYERLDTSFRLANEELGVETDILDAKLLSGLPKLDRASQQALSLYISMLQPAVDKHLYLQGP